MRWRCDFGNDWCSWGKSSKKNALELIGLSLARRTIRDLHKGFDFDQWSLKATGYLLGREQRAQLSAQI